MADIIAKEDLPAAAQASELVDLMVAAANAKASRVAPCLTWTGTPTDQPVPSADQLAEARLLLAGAISRWSEAGAGAVSTKTTMTGPYMSTETIDTKQRTGFNLWPSEIVQLQDICKAGGNSSAFTVDTAPSLCGEHLLWCSLNFGATYCSCGVDIAGYPIFEGADDADLPLP